MTAISIRNLSFSYPGKPVLSGLSLEIKEGEFLGVIGKTGCGKSTLLLSLNGIIPQMIAGEFSGAVEVFGKDTSKVPVHELARSVAFVFQDPDEQIFSLRVEDEVLFGLHNIGVRDEDARERVGRTLETMGLSEYADSDPQKLSHGQKQKLAFACALALEPDVFVLDEPVSSLDHSSSQEIYSLLEKLNREGKTIIVAEHDTEWLAEHASRIILLDNGKIEADGSSALLLDKKVAEAGIKVPCAARISSELGQPMLTPSQLIRHLKGKRR